MKSMLFWLGLGIVVGYFWGRYTTSKAFTIIFKQFQDEMHNQYLKLLERHNIKVKPEVKRHYQHITRTFNEKHDEHEHGHGM